MSRSPSCSAYAPVPVVLAIVCLLAPPSHGQDFGALTALAQAAVHGVGVEEAVPGFEVRVTQHGKLLYHRAFGDWSLDQPAAVDSSTKTLSGALVMALAETGAGGFSLDSRLADFLTEYDQPGYRDITVRQAFSHTSGVVGEDVTSLVLANPLITLREAARRIATYPLAATPAGETFAYGGLSMQATGAAAEVATGEAYLNLFAERITTPLGMTNTRFYTASDQNPRIAGGVESTATDFGRFMDALLNDGVDRATGVRFLSEASVAEMLTPQTGDVTTIANSPTGDSQYGIGVWLDQLDQAGPPVDVLAGGARGFHSWIDESHGLVFTFATDESSYSNVQLLSSRMHGAILRAVSVPEPTAGVLGLIGCVAAACSAVRRR